jgi:uncharacterized protein YndB with AHSA1/START domain
VERAIAITVFDARTSAEVMRRRFRCARIGRRRPRSAPRGEYALIDRPRRLQMTWPFDDAPSNRQTIEPWFSESAGSTTVVMVNSGISTHERRDAQHAGWHGCADELNRGLPSSVRRALGNSSAARGCRCRCSL